LHRKGRSDGKLFQLPSSSPFTPLPPLLHTAHCPRMEILCSLAFQSPWPIR
jgi:hypothetical protein